MANESAEISSLIKSNGSLAPRTSFKPSSRFEKRPFSEVTFKDFLDFLRTAYQINEAIEGVPDGFIDKVEIDWQDVILNEFICSLLTMNSRTNVVSTEGSDNNLKSSEASEQNEDTDVSKCSSHNSVFSSDGEVHKGNVASGADLKNKLGMVKENLLHELKKPQNMFLSDQLKNKILLPTKHINSRKKIVPNKKDEHKVKKTIDDNKTLEHLMKRKLNEVIEEGLLGSVLPYVVPKKTSTHSALKKTSLVDVKKPSSLTSLDKSSSGQFSKEKIAINNRRKSSSGEIEVEIHVCDEVKNLKRDFRCPQKLLVSKMGYFAEVTTGQKLEDMDISVHCDIAIFDWLMRWVKRDSLLEENWPKLDAGNVISILVSAAFLQMDPLLQDCLEFCRQHMNEIAKTSTNLSCLNDNILTRLANLFSNSNIEALRDKKDKIQSRLYCKLIMALTETSPEPARGHFASLASVYRCGKCHKLILRQLGASVACKPCNMKMDRFGNVHGNHIRDQNWNLNDYIEGLRQELKSWRHVYWRLWGDCHFLLCSACDNYFPVNQMKWCCHHSESAQFFTMEHQRAMTYPTGRYPCCGETAYRFQVLNNEAGCKFKEHMPALNTPRDIEVNKLYTEHHSLITLEPPTLKFPDRLTRLVSRENGKGDIVSRDVLWWDGIELAPPRPRQGILAKMWEMHQKKEQQHNTDGSSRTNSSASSNGTNNVMNRTHTPNVRQLAKKQMSMAEMSNSTSGNAEGDNSSSNDDSNSSTTSSDTENSEESGHAPVRRVTTKPRRVEAHLFTSSKNKVEATSQWIPKLPMRSNQDNQREYEERAVRQMAALLTRRTCADSSSLYARAHTRPHGHHSHSIWNNHIIPQGGIYVRLEHEWREANCHTHGCHGISNRQRSVGWGLSSRPRVRASR